MVFGGAFPVGVVDHGTRHRIFGDQKPKNKKVDCRDGNGVDQTGKGVGGKFKERADDGD